MKVAVVGASGFIGSAIVDACTRHQLTPLRVSLGRVQATPEDDLRQAVARWSHDNAVAFDRLRRALAYAAVVINAAGAAEPDSEDWHGLWASNVLLPGVVAAAAAREGVPRLVHVSSAAVQGRRDPWDESTEVDPFSAYARSKIAAERAFLDGAIESPPTVVLYRPTSVVGEGRPSTRRLLALASKRVVPIPAAPTALPIALVDNVADAAVFLARCADPPCIAVHPDEGMTLTEFVGVAGGRPVRLPRIVSVSGLAVLHALEVVRPGVAGLRRRAEVFANGQRIGTSSLTAKGWSPPLGLDAYRRLTSSEGAGPARIGYLITRADTVGGAQVHVRDLAVELQRRNAVVRVFVGGDGPYVEQLVSSGVDVVRLPSLVRALDPVRDAKALHELLGALRDFQPDLLSTHSSKSGIVGRLAGRRLGIPTLFTAHGWAFAAGMPWKDRTVYTAIELAAAPLASRLITVCDGDRALARRRHVGRQSQHTTIRNGVRDVSPDHRARTSSEPVTLIAVARFDEPKDHELLLRAVAMLPDRPASVLLVGDGPFESRIRELAELLDLGDQVEFLGLRDDVPDLLAQAQIFALASNSEGMPRSILEAMRAGLPIVASNVGGVSELVEHGRTGFLVSRGSQEEFSRALALLIADGPMRGRFGAEARSRYERHFTFDRLADETVDLYEQILGRTIA